MTGTYLKTGACYCIYNSTFLFIHLGFSTLSSTATLSNGTVLATLPVKVCNELNIGVFGSQNYQCIIGAINAINDQITVAGTLRPGDYLTNLVFKIA